jgi:hypothetical protein
MCKKMHSDTACASKVIPRAQSAAILSQAEAATSRISLRTTVTPGPTLLPTLISHEAASADPVQETASELHEIDAVPRRLRNPPRLAFGVSVWVARPHTSVASLFATRFRVEEQHK